MRRPTRKNGDGGSRSRSGAIGSRARLLGAPRVCPRAGALTEQGDAIFFLSIEEILAVLGGELAALASVPARRTTYARYCALPPIPHLIRGRFDPFRWAADPRRRSDLFDSRGDGKPADDAITGFPGAAGVVEGVVRVILTIGRKRSALGRRNSGDNPDQRRLDAAVPPRGRDRHRRRCASFACRDRGARARHSRCGWLWKRDDASPYRRPGARERSAGDRGSASGSGYTH